MFKIMLVALIAFFCDRATGASRHCFKCRSRGELGDCRDFFPYNGTTGQGSQGIDVVACPSGWCYKKIEGVRGPPDDFGTATERTCLTQAPSDGEERCAETKTGIKTSLVCFCRGNLCNSSTHSTINWMFLGICFIFLGAAR